MADTSTFHRDAARLARAQARLSQEKRQNERARWWRRQAVEHDLKADEYAEVKPEVQKSHSLMALFLREAIIQGWRCGYLSDRSAVVVDHPFCGRLWWHWNYLEHRIPSIVPEYPDDVELPTTDEVYAAISKYADMQEVVND